jgi:hypothetical protein
MDGLVSKLTAAEPEERIQSAQELLTVLNKKSFTPLPMRVHKA